MNCHLKELPYLKKSELTIKNDEEIELLEVDKSGIHVGQYLTQLPPKELLQEKLHKAIERARANFALKELD